MSTKTKAIRIRQPEARVPDTFKNFIAGEWVPADSDTTFENRNPADRDDLIGIFAASGPIDVERAVASAWEGFRDWSRVPAPKRGEVLKRAGDLLTERKDEIADGMTREMGKPLVETRGDVQEAIDTAYYAASEGRRLFGRTAPSAQFSSVMIWKSVKRERAKFPKSSSNSLPKSFVAITAAM